MGRTHPEHTEDCEAIGQSRIGERVARISRNGLLEEADRLQQARFGLS